MDNDLVQVLRFVIREELEPVNQRLEGMEVGQQGIKQDLIRISDNQEKIMVDLEMVKSAVLDTNERLINVESLLENQHRIIELLSARSIEQEAKLKRII